MKLWIPLCLTLVLPSEAALACAAVIDTNTEAVTVEAEQAVIVWDGEKKEEHFIRQAQFSTSRKNMGFLVPTPSRPRLSAIQPGVFEELEALKQPESLPEYHHEYRLGFYFQRGRMLSEFNAATAKIEIGAEPQILESHQLGDYDATILKAADMDGLNKWLKKNNFVSSPEITEWLETYVKKGWVLTAFKIRRDAQNNTAQLPAFRLSFATDRPFYPYSEPRRTGADAEARKLDLYFLSGSRVEGSLGEKIWPGKTDWTAEVDSQSVAAVASTLALESGSLSKSVRLTRFTDMSNPRPGYADVYFAPAQDQSNVKPPPIYWHVVRTRLIPLELILLPCVGGIAFIANLHFRRKRRSTLPESL